MLNLWPSKIAPTLKLNISFGYPLSGIHVENIKRTHEGRKYIPRLSKLKSTAFLELFYQYKRQKYTCILKETIMVHKSLTKKLTEHFWMRKNSERKHVLGDTHFYNKAEENRWLYEWDVENATMPSPHLQDAAQQTLERHWENLINIM